MLSLRVLTRLLASAQNAGYHRPARIWAGPWQSKSQPALGGTPMSLSWEAFLWSVIPVVLLAPAIAAWIYWLTRERPSTEDPADRAYREVKEAQAAQTAAADRQARPAQQAYAGTSQPVSSTR